MFKTIFFLLLIQTAKINAEGFHYSQCAFALKHLEKAGLVRLETKRIAPDPPPQLIVDIANEYVPNAKIEYLGSGKFGSVYRARNNSKSIDIKHYPNEESRTLKDKESLETLRDIAKPSFLKASKVIALKKNNLILESTYGVPLESYASDRNIPIEFRTKAVEKYQMAVKELEKSLLNWATQRGLRYEANDKGLCFVADFEFYQKVIYITDPVTGSNRSFFIKPDNIIVSPDGNLTIVDPY